MGEQMRPTKLTEEERRIIEQRDRELIDAHADELNREMEDVLRYQAPIEFTSEEQ